MTFCEVQFSPLVGQHLVLSTRWCLILTCCNRCGLCGGTSDGEPAGDTVPDIVELKAGSQDEGPKEGTSDLSKADGFGAGKGWLGRLLGPLGEHFGVGGAWVHENCAIWSPEVSHLKLRGSPGRFVGGKL